MRPRFRIFLLHTMLLCYTIAAAAGNSILWNSLFLSGADGHRVTAERSDHPSPGIPVLTIKAPAIQLYHGELSLHMATESVIPAPHRTPRFLSDPLFQSKYTYLESLPSKPRDPPLA